MLTSLYSAASGMETAEALHETTARNLAHAHLPGFRRALASHVPLSGRADQSTSSQSSSPSRERTDFSPGALQQTDEPLDVATHGDALFVVDGPQGPLYTRSGAFRLNSEGAIVTTDGLTVQGENGPLALPPGGAVSDLQISRDGVLSLGDNELGRLKLVSFADKSQLQPAGVTLFKALPEANPENATAQVVQGARELSNVQPVAELVALIAASRHYEAAQKSMLAISEATEKHIDLR